MATSIDQLWQHLRSLPDGLRRVPHVDAPAAPVQEMPPQPGALAEALAQPEGASRTLGLVLGGGGGKGGAHLGVLAVLNEFDIPVDVVVGTSIGGAIGVFYAAGFELDEIAEVFRAMTVRKIATADPTRTGFIGTRKREAVLEQALGNKTFADLRVPCAVVTVDLLSGREVVIDSGPLVPALLATTAVPAVFPPVVYNDMLLADGGILNNVPVDVAARLGADQVIAVTLNSEDLGFEWPASVPENPVSRLTLAPRQFAIANRALALMIAQATNKRLETHPPAVLLNPEVGQIGTLDMSRPELGWSAGERVAREHAEALALLRAWRIEPSPAPGALEPQPETRSLLERWRTFLQERRPARAA